MTNLPYWPLDELEQLCTIQHCAEMALRLWDLEFSMRGTRRQLIPHPERNFRKETH